MSTGDEESMVRVTFVIYEGNTLFKSQTVRNFNDEQDQVNRGIFTRIASCTIGNQIVTNLREPVEIAFRVLTVSKIVEVLFFQYH